MTTTVNSPTCYGLTVGVVWESVLRPDPGTSGEDGGAQPLMSVPAEITEQHSRPRLPLALGDPRRWA